MSIQICPECRGACVFTINGWWCRRCDWADVRPSPDNCPECGRFIRDFDMTGCETVPGGQRWCVAHLPADHPMRDKLGV